MMARRLLKAAEVAALFGNDVEWFYRNRKRLEREGFPQPAFGNGHGARWDPKAIGLWQDSRIDQPAAPETNGGVAIETLPKADHGKLARRARALAAGRLAARPH